MKFSSRSSISLSAVGAVVCLAFIPTDAHAYLDPGTGSVVLQVLVAGILGAAFTIKTYFRAISASVARLFGKKGNASDS